MTSKTIEKKRDAAIIKAGQVVGLTTTALKNGSYCCFGQENEKLEDCILQVGEGRISRLKANLQKAYEKSYDEDHNYYYVVNQGGGNSL